MLKRTAAILFILLANIVMLAHLVTPHHHHQKEVCYIDSHCESDHDAHDAAEHEHDSNTPIDFCALQQDLTIPSSQLKEESLIAKYITKHPAFDGYQAILFNTDIQSFTQEQFKHKSAHVCTSLYACCLSSSLGLRGPPTV